ncbi:kynurenine formamidase-like [Patiria miniata]|uniref:BD-FAE-like domain-containing protein n=1 Tax=Patiria miniata TaxID=46514 RepID=A0A914AIT1_PATMI|nr:kynurenine formamidase-like [Patiria miniata]
MADESEWEHLSGKELDNLVSPSHWSNRLHLFPNIVEHFLTTIASETKSIKKCIAHELNINYGEGKFQKLDLYLPPHQTEDSPVLISIHGGYWQASSKDDYGLFAWHPAKQGAVVAVVNYTIAPMGTLPQMINDVEQAVLYMAKKFPKAR